MTTDALPGRAGSSQPPAPSKSKNAKQTGGKAAVPKKPRTNRQKPPPVETK
jgi:hypothetical protein